MRRRHAVQNTHLFIALILTAPPAIAQSLPSSPALLSPNAAILSTADTVRPHAVEYSDLYFTRLKIHRIGSFAALPLFGAEYLLGEKLLDDENPKSWVKPTHVGVAAALGAVFAVNTATGVWNLWDARKDPNDRARRYLHSAIMIASDAGFVWAAMAAGDADETLSAARHHKKIALGSIGLSTVGTVMMWLWKD